MYVRPRTVEEACEALAAHSSRILSGGTDFFPALGDRPSQDRIVDLSALGGLDQIEMAGDEIRIEGRVTWSQIVRTDLPLCFTALQQAAREVGSIQIQNVATVAGNLCNASPAADGVPPLLVLDARVELTSLERARRLALADFITGNGRTLRRPDELLTAIVIPRRVENARSSFLKLGSRRYLVISMAMVAVAMTTDESGRISDIKIAVGACSAVAQRLGDLEQALIGVPATAGIGALVRPDHVAYLAPIDDIRATATYRRDAALTLVQRTLERCVGEVQDAP